MHFRVELIRMSYVKGIDFILYWSSFILLNSCYLCLVFRLIFNVFSKSIIMGIFWRFNSNERNDKMFLIIMFML